MKMEKKEYLVFQKATAGDLSREVCLGFWLYQLLNVQQNNMGNVRTHVHAPCSLFKHSNESTCNWLDQEFSSNRVLERVRVGFLGLDTGMCPAFKLTTTTWIF